MNLIERTSFPENIKINLLKNMEEMLSEKYLEIKMYINDFIIFYNWIGYLFMGGRLF